MVDRYIIPLSRTLKKARHVLKELTSEILFVSLKDFSSDGTEHGRIGSGHAIMGKKWSEDSSRNFIRPIERMRRKKKRHHVIKIGLILLSLEKPKSEGAKLTQQLLKDGA